MNSTTKGSWKFASVTHHYEYVGSCEIIEMNENPEREEGRRGRKRESTRKNEKRFNRKRKKELRTQYIFVDTFPFMYLKLLYTLI